jgi:hypothetical protein
MSLDIPTQAYGYGFPSQFDPMVCGIADILTNAGRVSMHWRTGKQIFGNEKVSSVFHFMSVRLTIRLFVMCNFSNL